ncbi:MAG TPA: polyprenol phosphomannose-dependent alpha 1,6 mannosyltransferase MptB [Pseudonocardiaceae bacterium]|nr:polyprenol phosphomannose-dependent alpha 1,6 mannosyltransferase MptB [Pseudonocardiaceae bacterium]
MPVRIILMGFGGLALMAVSAIGAAAVLEPDPILNGTAFSWLGYGHGKALATAVFYIGVALFIVAWIRLGREVRAGRVDQRGMLIAIGVWVAPLLLAPPLSSRDIFSYLAQGDLALHGFDPYQYGVSVLNDHLSANVDPIWQNTPAPYGPLFILVAKCVVVVTGQSTIVGVLAMRATMCTGLLLLCWALPRLATHLGGRPTVALWFGVANPLVLVYLVGGGHNDLLMMGLLAAGVALVLNGRHSGGMALVAGAFAVKATAGIALPFLVWIWASRLPGSTRTRFYKATAGCLAIVLPVFTLCSLAAGVNLGWLPALSASSVVILWISLPTAAGQLSHAIASQFASVDGDMFMSVARLIGWVVLIGLVSRQWWLAREGNGSDTVRRLALAMLIVALFSPATLPWYFSWGLILAAGLSWSTPGLVLGTFGSVWVMLITYPTGASALYSWVPMALVIAASALAAVSLVRPDPLKLSDKLHAYRAPRVALGDPGIVRTDEISVETPEVALESQRLGSALHLTATVAAQRLDGRPG